MMAPNNRALAAAACFAMVLLSRPISASASLEDLSPSLQCSACKWLADGAQRWVSRRARKWKKWTKPKRRKWVRGAMRRACSKLPAQVAKHGVDGEKVYEDFQALLSKGGSMSGISVSPKVKDELRDACQELVRDYGWAVEEGYADVRRPSSFAIRRELCTEVSGACRGGGAARGEFSSEESASLEAELAALLEEDDNTDGRAERGGSTAGAGVQEAAQELSEALDGLDHGVEALEQVRDELSDEL